jgi:excisionase family DNA binding protein
MQSNSTNFCVPSPLMDPETAGAYLGVKKLTLCDWRTKGVGPSYLKVGSLVRYRQADLDAWLESRIRKGAA